MKPEKQQLLNDLLGDESRSESTLLATGKILRRRRRWRAASQIFAVLLLATATVLLVAQNRPRQPLAQNSSPAKDATPPAAQSLTDEQLLSLFPDTPVALATLPNGKKLLIFPRPGDEAKFVKRL
jgi:hypothetical protein